MRPTLLVAFWCAMSIPAVAQEAWSIEGLQGSGDPFGALLASPEGATFGLGDMPAAPRAPLVYGGCLIAEDGVTPLLCAGGDGIKPPPEGFVWKDDPEASLSEPQHCLWWEEGQAFVGIPGIGLCREGPAPSGGRPPESIRPLEPQPSDGSAEPSPPEEVF